MLLRTLFISFILHLALIYALVSDNKPARSTVEIEIKKTPQSAVKTQVPPSPPVKANNHPKRDVKPILKGTSNTPNCPNSFGGIGIYVTGNEYEGLVDQAVPGYPAYNAGIRPGDVFKVVGGGGLRGEVGSTVKLLVERAGVVYNVSLVREKICYE